MFSSCSQNNSYQRISHKGWRLIYLAKHLESPLMMKLRRFLSTLAGGALLLALQCNAQAAAPSVTQEEARAALENGSAVVIDIREPAEQASGVAKGALLIPMGQIAQHMAELPKPDQKPLIVMCATQNRSSRLVAQLQAAGYTNARYVQGGMSQWTARGWPLVKP